MKFYGVIGYVETVETEPGIWEEKNTERAYYGDLIRNFGKHEPSGNVNDNINIANEVSMASPRLILTIGGVYNGNTA